MNNTSRDYASRDDASRDEDGDLRLQMSNSLSTIRSFKPQDDFDNFNRARKVNLFPEELFSSPSEVNLQIRGASAQSARSGKKVRPISANSNLSRLQYELEGQDQDQVQDKNTVLIVDESQLSYIVTSSLLQELNIESDKATNKKQALMAIA